MVQNPRTKTGVNSSYQPLNIPERIYVSITSDGQPATVTLTAKGRRLTQNVSQIIDFWELDDEWWRISPLRRRYFRLLMDNGRTTTVFKDLGNNEWFQQEY